MRRFTVALALVLSLALGGCGKDGAPATAPKPGEGPDAKAVEVRPAQKQFLTIEAVGAGGAGDVLALPGRVAFRPQGALLLDTQAEQLL